MANLKILDDETLLAETQRLVRGERELLTQILHHLREIERRRLYVGHPSIFMYAVKVLGYSEDQAYRRIAAMRLLKELPEIEEQIQSGQINLTHVGLAHSLFASERKAGQDYSTEKKLEVFAAMAGQTSRDAQKTIVEYSSSPAPSRETIKPLGNGRLSITIEISEAAFADLQKIRGLLAHASPDLALGDVMAKAAKVALEQMNPARPPTRETKPDSVAAVRRRVFERDGGVCVWCASDYLVEIDHIKPEAMGGEDTVENLRLLCRSCNERVAIEIFGQEKMDPHLSPAAPRVRVRHERRARASG